MKMRWPLWQRHKLALFLWMMGVGVCSATSTQEVPSMSPDPNGHRKSLSYHMNRRVINQVWQERVRSLDEGQTPEKAEMRRLIEKLNGVRIKEPKTPLQGTSATVEVAQAETPAPIPSQESVDESAESEGTSVLRDDTSTAFQGPLRTSTLAEIHQIQEANEWVDDPLTLAEMLYVHGYRDEACWFYEQTLHQADPNTPLDRSWVLLQLGNCTKQNDPLTARRYYRQGIEADDESPWAALARVQLALVELMISERPQDLLQDSQMSPSTKGDTLSNEGR